MTAATVAPLVLLGSLVSWFFYAWRNERAHARRRLALLRAEWGKTKDLSPNLAAVAAYHKSRRGGARSGVDDGTWRDLGMDAIFAHLDRTGSFGGSASLYDRLRTPEASLGSVRRFDEIVTTFTRDAATRETVQSVFASMNEYGQSAILEILFGEAVRPSAMRHLFPFLGGLNVGALALLVASHFAAPALAVVFARARARRASRRGSRTGGAGSRRSRRFGT